MADALLFFRNFVVRQSVVPNPDDLPAAFKLQFTLPDELLEAVTLVHENNIKDSSISNPQGVRKIQKQDNGLQGLTLTFKGRFRDASTDIEQAQRFARRLQLEGTHHQFGIFGFKASNTVSTPFNFDPSDTFGFTIRRLTLARQGSKPKNFDFEIIMTSGGELAQL